MSTASLLSLAGVITKDPDHDEYGDTIKYQMLSAAQAQVALKLNVQYLERLKEDISETNVASPGDIVLPTNYFRLAHAEISGVPVEIVPVEAKGRFENPIYGGTDVKPYAFVYKSGSDTVMRVVVTTYPISQVDFWHVQEPAAISGSQEPQIVGFDAQILAYFKYLYHLAENQTAEASAAFQVWLKTMEGYM